MKKFLFVLIVLLGVCFWGWRSYHSALRYQLDPASDRRVAVSVVKGSTADTVATTLKEKKLIESPFFFKLYLRLQGLSGSIQAGHFVLRENDDLPAIVANLVEGKSQEVAVTLLEGWTARQIGEQLESLGLTTADAFTECVHSCVFDSPLAPKAGGVEGYLYPDTYFVDPGTYSDKSFIARLIGTLQSRLTEADLETLKKTGRTLEEVVKMASIVEREERDPEARPVIAGILWKRLDNGIALGADATSLYGLGRTSGELTYNDLQDDSPYNTRKHRGLPPTPISNPHLSSIQATLYPEESPYLYYLHDSKGQVHYGKTLEEHNENKRKYL